MSSRTRSNATALAEGLCFEAFPPQETAPKTDTPQKASETRAATTGRRGSRSRKSLRDVPSPPFAEPEIPRQELSGARSPGCCNITSYFTYGQGRQLGGTPEENAKLATAENWRASRKAKTILRTIECTFLDNFAKYWKYSAVRKFTMDVKLRYQINLIN